MKSETIHGDLRNRISSGEFNTAKRLPSEKELCSFYGCSRPTLRKAMEILELDKLISTRQGSGSFITPEGIHLSNETMVVPKAYQFGIIFPSLGDHYVFGTICSEVARIVAQQNCSLVWGGSIPTDSKNLMSEIRQICQKYVELRVDGVFFSPLEYTGMRDDANSYVISTFEKAHVPIVLIDSDIVDFPLRTDHDLVSLDHIQAGYIIANHMLQQKIERLHFLAPPMSTKTIKLRLIGYREALYDAGIIVSSGFFHEGDPSNEDFLKTIMASDPQGILCSNDGTAISLLGTLRKLNVRVPHDLIVGGFDNLSYLSQIRTPLTSISQPTETISREAVRLMMDRVQHAGRPSRTVRVSGTLITRRSTRFGHDSD
jgi:GntR family transcriptional regulator, arabinose operon transcriptional repressor